MYLFAWNKTINVIQICAYSIDDDVLNNMYLSELSFMDGHWAQELNQQKCFIMSKGLRGQDYSLQPFAWNNANI